MKPQILFATFTMGLLCLVASAQQSDTSTTASTTLPVDSDRVGPMPSTGHVQPLSSELAAESPVPTGRLPRYFAAVVSPEQREAIYRIQASYRGKIEQLERQLEALQASEMQEVEQVLSETQLQRVMEMREQARERLSARYSQPSEPVEGISESGQPGR